MFGSNTRKASAEMKCLIKEARDLFNEASVTTNDNADSLRKKGLQLLESGFSNAKNIQADAIETGKEFAGSANNFVRENPWRSVAVTGAIAAGIGVIVGLSASRK